MRSLLATLAQLDAEWSARVVLTSDNHKSDVFSIRFFFLFLEWTAHGIPWIISTVIAVVRSFHYGYPREEQWKACVVLFGIFFDLLITGILKLSFRRPRPPYNKQDDQIFEAPVADKFSFPSGHTTRSTMLAVVALGILNLSNPLHRAAVIAYPFLLGSSRVMMGRHYIGDVLAGFIAGYFEGCVALMLSYDAVDLGRQTYFYALSQF